jgi:hypothetical protein
VPHPEMRKDSPSDLARRGPGGSGFAHRGAPFHHAFPGKHYKKWMQPHRPRFAGPPPVMGKRPQHHEVPWLRQKLPPPDAHRADRHPSKDMPPAPPHRGNGPRPWMREHPGDRPHHHGDAHREMLPKRHQEASEPRHKPNEFRGA